MTFKDMRDTPEFKNTEPLTDEQVAERLDRAEAALEQAKASGDQQALTLARINLKAAKLLKKLNS